MPEVGSKKRTQQTGSGKLTKRGGSSESTPVVEIAEEVVDTITGNLDDLIDKNDLNLEPATHVPEVIEPVKDIMRTEPALNPIFIKSYQGEFDENGFYHGKGKLSLKDGMSYNGLLKHGKMHDKGEIKWPNSTSFIGDLNKNVISGNGTYSWSDNSSYKGEVMNSLRHGTGSFICPDLKKYVGEWKYGKRHGKGIIYFDQNGQSYYNGDWYNNEKCGYGVRRFANGNVYEGEWEENKRNGLGTMYWTTSGQEYTGNWVNGFQNGHGEYTWYLKRVTNSQYPLRNKYVGNFVNGERHGYGTFYYASGAVYEGEWEHNMKHGKGKFTFKNGSTFTGQFHNDHMIDFPDLILPHMMTPDIVDSGIPVKSAMSSVRTKSVMGMTQNAVDAILDIDLHEIFDEYKYDLEERQEEMESIMRIILRLTTQLKNIYKVYSCLGSDLSIDNTFVMSKCQFLRFLKDYGVHKLGYTLAELDTQIEGTITGETYSKELFIRDFLNHLIKISYLIFKKEVLDDASVISNSFSKLTACLLENKDVSVKGYIYKSIKKTQEVHKFINKIFEIYFYFSCLYYSSGDRPLTLRNALVILKEMGLINETLNSTKLVQILTQEDQVEEGYFNLENAITPFEFVEVIIGSSSIFVSDQIIEKLRPSHVLPILSLDTVNVDAEVSFINKTEEKEIKLNDVVVDSLQCVSQEVLSTKESIADSSLSVKSKSSRKVNRKLSVSKKVEKELSTSSTSKMKKEGSKTGRKSSSIIKMEDAKKKSTVIDPEIPDTNQESISVAKSIDSTVENITESVDIPDVSITSCSELPVKSPIKEEEVDLVISEKLVPEQEENFELWSLRLNLFLKDFLFPAFEKRKHLEELVKASEN